MYICICNDVTQHEIEQAVKDNHVATVTDLQDKLDVGTSCGQCINHAVDLLNITLDSRIDK